RAMAAWVKNPTLPSFGSKKEKMASPSQGAKVNPASAPSSGPSSGPTAMGKAPSVPALVPTGEFVVNKNGRVFPQYRPLNEIPVAQSRGPTVAEVVAANPTGAASSRAVIPPKANDEPETEQRLKPADAIRELEAALSE
ncbi:MAG: hypothetical protein AAB731_00375, partial [Patescibacteria group bacterium]